MTRHAGSGRDGTYNPHMPYPAHHLASVPASQIREVTELAWATPGTAVLSVGEPDLPTAPRILRAAEDALRRDDTRYTPNAGIAPLREAVAGRERERGIAQARADRVWITAGAAQGIHLALSLTLGAGDDVLVPDPGYPPFSMAAALVQARPVPYPLRARGGFLPDPTELERVVTDRTRAIVLNSPSNPLGTVLDADLLGALLAFARRHDLWVISDECYDAFTFGVEHVPAAALDRDGRVLTLVSWSKTYAMTGFRVGALLVPRAFDPWMARVQEAIVSCVNTPAQYAALAALTGPQEDVAAARAVYRRHRDLATGLLASRGLRFQDARGGIYVWVDLSHASGGDVHALALRLVRERGVAVAPGTAFGRAGQGWARISLTASDEDLRRGIARLPRPEDGRGEPMPDRAGSGRSEGDPDAQHDQSAHCHDDERSADRHAQEAVAHPGDDGELHGHDREGDDQGQVGLRDEERQGVEHATDRGREARHDAAHHPGSASGLRAGVRQGL